MGRYIFKGLIIASAVFHSDGGMATFHDPISFAQNVAAQGENAAKYGEMIKSGAEQLEQAKKIASTASETLNTANQAVSKLQTMNSVLGSPLKDSVLQRLAGLKSLSQSYGGFLGAMGSDNGDRLQSLNGFANREFGTEDRSRLLAGKNYFQRQFFPEDSRTINLDKARSIKLTREQAAKDTVLTSLAVSKQHKEDLSKDHNDLMLISQSGVESSTINHQTRVQTKLLERIAQSLEKIILLQSQQLEFMAKTYIGDRGVAIGELQEKTN